jgi:hypothetical protein
MYVEQLEDCLSDAIYQYNRWRNFSEELIYTNLDGDPIIGYAIPPEVGGADNVIEIIVRPKYSIVYYNRGDEIISNLFVQYLFKKVGTPNLGDYMSDYYVSLSTESDYNTILGTQVKWEIINKRLFIWPTPNAMNVGIRYRSSLLPSEIVTNYWIRRYVLAEAKIVLGNVRSVFKNGIPGGNDVLQLNGEELKAEGKQERDELLEEMKKSAEPLFLTWF